MRFSLVTPTIRKTHCFLQTPKGNESRKCGIGGRRVRETNLRVSKILGDSFADTRSEEEEEEEAISFVTKTEPQVSPDRSTADMYLLRELERYKVRKAQERRKARNEEILSDIWNLLTREVAPSLNPTTRTITNDFRNSTCL